MRLTSISTDEPEILRNLFARNVKSVEVLIDHSNSYILNKELLKFYSESYQILITDYRLLQLSKRKGFK